MSTKPTFEVKLAGRRGALPNIRPIVQKELRDAFPGIADFDQALGDACHATRNAAIRSISDAMIFIRSELAKRERRDKDRRAEAAMRDAKRMFAELPPAPKTIELPPPPSSAPPPHYFLRSHLITRLRSTYPEMDFSVVFRENAGTPTYVVDADVDAKDAALLTDMALMHLRDLGAPETVCVQTKLRPAPAPVQLQLEPPPPDPEPTPPPSPEPVPEPVRQEPPKPPPLPLSGAPFVLSDKELSKIESAVLDEMMSGGENLRTVLRRELSEVVGSMIGRIVQADLLDRR